MHDLQANVDWLTATLNVNLDYQFESTIVNQLPCGHRINKGVDDAAGLAAASGRQSDGLGNVSAILDPLQMLANQSASSAFNCGKATINQDCGCVISKISRQASNISMKAGGILSQNFTAFEGVGRNTADSAVSVDLRCSMHAVDACSSHFTDTSILGGGNELTGNTLSPNNSELLSELAIENFPFNVKANGVYTTKTITVRGSNGGNGGSNAFDMTDWCAGKGFTASVPFCGLLNSVGAASSLKNGALYSIPGSTTDAAATGPAFQPLILPANAQTLMASRDSTETAATAPYGMYANENLASNGVNSQSNSNFTVGESLPTC